MCCHVSEEIWLIKNKFKVLFWGGLRYLASVTGIRQTEELPDKLIALMPRQFGEVSRRGWLQGRLHPLELSCREETINASVLPANRPRLVCVINKDQRTS